MADRTVTTRLKLAVTDFVAGGRQATGTLRDLDRKFTESAGFAQGFRKKLEDAAKRLPPIDIDVNSSAAEVKIAEIRSRLESLSSKQVGVDIDATAAYTELQALQRELEAIDDKDVAFEVRAGVAQAMAELRSIDSEISRVDGRTASVDVNADVGGALTSIAMIGAALAALPAVTTIAVGVTALGSAFTAAGIGAGAFAAVAVPSMGRISEALKAQESAAKGAGAATGGAGQSAAQAAQQAMQLEQAEKRLKDAQNEERAAQEDLTRAREAGRRALEDMNFSLERSILSQKDAALAEREAEARLAEVQGKFAEGKASELELERAMLSVDMAHQRSREQEVKTQRAKKDTAEANKAGVKGTAEYQKGLDRLAQAEAKVTEATAALKQAQLAQQAAMSGGGGGAAKLKDAFADLSKSEKALALDMQAFSKEYVAWQRSLQPDVFPAIHQGLDLMRLGLQAATPLAKTAGISFTTLGKEAEQALRGPFWGEFLYDTNTVMPAAIIGLGRSFGNVVTGIAGVLDAFMPFVPTVVGGAEKASRAFSEWGQNLEDNPQFHEFIAFVKREAPEVWELIKDGAKALGNVAEAVAPLGAGAFSGLGLLAKIVADMDPGRIQAIALAVGAIKLASMGMSGIAAWQNLAGGIGATGAAAGKAQGKMAAFGKAAIGVSAGVIGLELLGSAMNSLAGQSEGVGELTLALTELGQTGKWAGDLGEQWGGTFDDASKAAGLFGDGLRELQDPSFGEMFWLHPLSELTALLPGIDSTVDQLEQKFADMDKTLAGMVQSGNADTAAKAFQELAKQAAAQGIPVAKLNELLPTYNQTLRVAGNAAAEAAAGVDLAKQKLDGFNSSVDAFASRTDALTAMQALRSAYAEAEKAIQAANGQLEVNARMTDEQRDAVVTAREQFAGYIEKVRLAAEGAQTLNGKTTDGTRAILEQLPELGKLAGKNSEAREQILKLAEAYGISRSDAEKAMGSAKGLRDMLAQLKSKELEITANTEKAVNALKSLLSTYIKPYEIPIGIRAPATPPKKRAAGGIERYASGGVRRPSPAPHIAASPTVLFGEGRAPEAFIPYDPAFRRQAVAQLSEVANDFGLLLSNQQAATGLANLSVTIDDSGLQISDRLTGVMGSLEATMGQTGSLTSSIGQVGASADQLNASWLSGSAIIGDTVSLLGTVTSDAVEVMTEEMTSSISLLATSVEYLGQAVSVAAQMTSSTSTSSGKSKASKGKAGAVDASATKTTAPRKGTGGMIAGDYGLSGTPDWSPGTSSAIAYGDVPINSSHVSAPQMAASGAVFSAAAPAAGAAAASGAGRASGGGIQVPITMNGVTVRQDADIPKIGSEVGFQFMARPF